MFLLFSSLLLFSHLAVSDALWPHELQHARLPCPSQCSGTCSNSCPLSWWCHPTISSLVVPFSSCLQSFPASGSFPMSRLFSSGGQSIGASASASVLPTNIKGWLYDFWCYKTEFFKDILGIFWGSLKPLSEGLWSQNHFIIIWKHFSLLSSGHVWMWELNHKESWAPKN